MAETKALQNQWLVYEIPLIFLSFIFEVMQTS